MPRQPYLDAVAERVVVFDGAFGTYIQDLDLGPDDFGGPALEGCNEMLCLTRPDVIAGMHAAFFDVGVDVVETASFGSFSTVLVEYGIADRAHELNVASARIARAGRRQLRRRPHPVRGRFDRAGHEAAEPRQHRLRRPARRLRGAGQRAARGRRRPARGRDLLRPAAGQGGADRLPPGDARRRARGPAAGAGHDGDDRSDADRHARSAPRWSPCRPCGPTCSGSTAPPVRPRCRSTCATSTSHSPLPISVLPNAGLPSVVDGRTHYDLTPEQLAEFHARHVSELGIHVVGGCCGTTPEHLRQVVDAVRDLTPASRAPVSEPSVASIYSPVPIEQDLSFLIIGERTNANGSKAFREAMLAGDWDTCTKMANEQVREGAHVLDVCVDYVGRDGAVDMDEIAKRFATQSSVPLVLDSTETPVIEAALQHIGGRPILNSANLEDGELPDSRFDRVMSLAREYGAAVICLLIDERGQARDVEWKLEIAHRIHEIATERYGLSATDLIFDALTFPLSTGDDDLRRDADLHARGDQADQGRDPRRPHHARRVQRQLRAQPRRPPRAEQRVPPRGRAGGAGLGDRPRRQDRPAQPAARRPARGLPRPGLGPAANLRGQRRDGHLRPAAAAARGVRRRQVDEDREAGPFRPAGPGAAAPPHRRRRPRRPDRRSRRGAGQRPAPPWRSSTTCCSAA